MMSWWKRIFLGLIVLLALSQFFRPSHVNPPVVVAHTIEANLAVPPDVASTLHRSCNDCHSHQSVWPWYSNVAPISWLLAYDVRHGRAALNLSEWSAYPASEQKDLLTEICTEVSDSDMPGIPYVWVHPQSKLSDAEMKSVCRWAAAAQPKQPAEQQPATTKQHDPNMD